MSTIPVTMGYDDSTVVGRLEIIDDLVPGHQLKEMHVSWMFDSREGRVLQMSLMPTMVVQENTALFEEEHTKPEHEIRIANHLFMPSRPGWFMPRCKICREFEDHPLHKV